MATAAVVVLSALAAACSDAPEPTAAPPTPSVEGDHVSSLDPDEVAGETAPTSSVAQEYRWETLSSGAGGFVTGMSVDPTGQTLLARTDVGGAYRWDRADGVWRQLLSAETVADPQRNDYFVESLVVAPSDPDRLYLAAGISDTEPTGRLLRSDDGGGTWTPGVGDVVIFGNGAHRNGAERLAVDPTDPDEVWFATRTQGLLVSRDGGRTTTPVEGVPVTAGPEGSIIGTSFVVGDDSGATWWAGVAGVGIFLTTDDGATWTLIHTTEGIPTDAEVDTLGRLWVVEDRPGAVLVIDGATVTIATAPSDALRVLGLDPTDPDRALVGGPGIANGALWRTLDAGVTWTSVEITTSCPSVPWLDAYDNDYFPTGSLLSDPVDGSLWVPEGFGIWRATQRDGPTLDLECEVAGVEELVSNDVVVPPGGRPVTAHWDRAIFHHGSTDAIDAIQGPTSRFSSAWDLDWSPADPSVMVAVVGDHRFCCEDDGAAYASGWSGDGGRTWTRFASYDGDHPDELRFGNIAVAADDVDNLVWLPSFNGAPHVTRDRGATWTRIVLPGTEDRFDEDGVYVGGSHFAYYLNRKVLAADRVRPGTFHLYHAELGLFTSTDGGTTWTRAASVGLPVGWTAGFFNATLVASPTEAGHLLFAPGELDEETTGLYETFDGGQNWQRIPAVTDVGTMTWGAPAPGLTEPTLYFTGRVAGEAGLWRSSADLDGWELVSTAPAGNYQLPKVLGADADDYGTVYVGFEGSSFVVGRLDTNPTPPSP